MIVQNFNKVRQIVESNNDDPRLIVLAVTDDRDFFGTGVIHRLFECRVKPELFAPLALDVDVRDVCYNIRGVGGTLKLDAASGGDAQNAGKFGGQFPFTPFSFSF